MTSDVAEIPDASDRTTTDNRSRDRARYERDDADVVRKVMLTKPGRAWMHRILESCRIFETPFTPGQSDTTAFRLGEQNVGNRMLHQVMAASSDLYIMMMQEARDEEKRVAQTVRDRNLRETKLREDVENAGGAHNLPPPPGYSK